MSKIPKKRKFQIEPNSLSAIEESATKGVLRRMRNPSAKVEESPGTGEKPFEPQKLELVEKIQEPETSLPEKTVEIKENFGQPVNQNPVNQLTTMDNQTKDLVVNQKENEMDNQLASKPVNQLTSENSFRTRRERKLKGLRLPKQKLEKWELWCFVNKYDFQDAVEIAMDWLTSQPNHLLTSQLDNHVLIDDIDDNKETDESLIFYQKWTGNKIKPKDRLARESVRKFSNDIIKIGIMTAISRTKTKINSFAYCIPVIEEVADDAEIVKDKDNYLKGIERFIERSRKGMKNY